MKVWAQSRYFHILGGAILESWGRDGWGEEPPRCLLCILGFWLILGNKALLLQTCLKVPGLGDLASPFPELTFYFSQPQNTGHQGKRMGKTPWAQDSCLLPPVGAELLEAEETEMGAARWC